ncbi:DinB family protein [Neobacillus sp. FSL H8-0543]|uniref:DinB family protein n=1 Tax=Neobacillus sp. FSL H8-0543 TaxID=2954672 RepID=UPI00315876F3
MIQRPTENEYPAYYQPYVSLVPDTDLVQLLNENLQETVQLFESISEIEGLFRYAPTKWSIKEVLGHMTDTERIMSYRLMRIGRGDQTSLSGFNENDYVVSSQINQLPIRDILDDFIATRKATLTLIHNMPTDAWAKVGVANVAEITTQAIAYIIAGHAIHHRTIITERYLSIM